MSLKFAPDDAGALDLHVIPSDGFDAWLQSQPETVATWVRQSGFSGALGSTLTVPGPDGTLAMALAGYGTEATRSRGRFHLAAAAASLPEGTYRLQGLDPARADEEALGWLLSGYAFDRYKDQKSAKARLIPPESVDAGRLEIIAAGEALTPRPDQHARLGHGARAA